MLHKKIKYHRYSQKSFAILALQK